MDEDLQHIEADPGPLLEQWLDRARRESGQTNWNTMYLSTVGADGRPAVRAVLHKGFDPVTAKLTFFTNYRSRKAEEIKGNANVALVMHWDRLERQVRIEGTAAPTTPEESDAYFATRARVSQIGAWSSDQSEPLDTQQRLRLRVAATALRFAGRRITRPEHWGGYVVTPQRIEFWRAMPGRIHRRVLYERADEQPAGWSATWLYP